MIKVILVDAANTIIHKPALWTNITKVLQAAGFKIPPAFLREKHKLISELINFPDRTNETFYRNFNAELLLALGILPEEELLNDLFKACTYLPWEAFSDVEHLDSLKYKRAVLSNFNSGLADLLKSTVALAFDEIIVSEIEKVRKPQEEFYTNAIRKLKVDPAEIVYVGDSIKLDMIPALATGMKAILIDRENLYPYYPNRIGSFQELSRKIDELKTA